MFLPDLILRSGLKVKKILTMFSLLNNRGRFLLPTTNFSSHLSFFVRFIKEEREEKGKPGVNPSKYILP